nr:hypothetical protein [Tanacetum cinerariifolium]
MSRDVIRRTMPVETPNSLALVSCDGLGGYDWSNQAEEGLKNYALMAYYTSLSSSSDSKIVDNYKKGLEYNAVPLPHKGLFPPLKSNLSYTGLEELFNKPKNKKSKDKSNDVEPELVREGSDALIIKDWVSDDEEETVKKKEVKPSINWVNFVKAATDNNPRETVKNVNAAKAKAKYTAVKGNMGNVVKASACWVKGKQENDKVRTKSDKNGKRGEARKSQSQLQDGSKKVKNKGTNASNSDVSKVSSDSTSPTSLENKIHEIENQMLEGKLVFLDDDVKQLKPNIGSEHGIGDEVFEPEKVTSERMNFESTNNFKSFNSTLHVEVEQRENGPQIISASISFARVVNPDKPVATFRTLDTVITTDESVGVLIPLSLVMEANPREHRRMILESFENGPLIWPTVEENGVIKTKKYVELSVTKKIQTDCDMKATNIILQGLLADIYSLVNHHRVAKDLWERVQLLMQGTSLTKQEKECKLYDAFDTFTHIKRESFHKYYLRFTQLINDMNIYNMKMEQFQVNTKFLNSLPPE